MTGKCIYGLRRCSLVTARLTLDRAVRARALAGDIVLCSWARHLTLTVPLSTQVDQKVSTDSVLFEATCKS